MMIIMLKEQQEIKLVIMMSEAVKGVNYLTLSPLSRFNDLKLMRTMKGQSMFLNQCKTLMNENHLKLFS